MGYRKSKTLIMHSVICSSRQGLISQIDLSLETHLSMLLYSHRIVPES